MLAPWPVLPGDRKQSPVRVCMARPHNPCSSGPDNGFYDGRTGRTGSERSLQSHGYARHALECDREAAGHAPAPCNEYGAVWFREWVMSHSEGCTVFFWRLQAGPPKDRGLRPECRRCGSRSPYHRFPAGRRTCAPSPGQAGVTIIYLHQYLFLYAG